METAKIIYFLIGLLYAGWGVPMLIGRGAIKTGRKEWTPMRSYTRKWTIICGAVFLSLGLITMLSVVLLDEYWPRQPQVLVPFYFAAAFVYSGLQRKKWLVEEAPADKD